MYCITPAEMSKLSKSRSSTSTTTVISVPLNPKWYRYLEKNQAQEHIQLWHYSAFSHLFKKKTGNTPIIYMKS